MKTNIISLLGLLSVLLLSAISCSDREQELTDFENQNIPQNLCGTYYSVERGENYYQYLTINADGKMEGVYVSGGKSSKHQGECYYNEGKMIFYYNNGNNWSQLYGAERSVVEWTSEYLVLGGFNASFLSKSKQTPVFVGQEQNENLIGQWIYNQTETATATLILKGNGLGSREFSSPVDYSYKNIVSWFTFNDWIYIKYDGQPDYEIWRYNLSGETLYLYYCDILEIDSNYDYHKDNNESEDDEAKSLIGTWVGYDGTPGLEWTDKYTLTFYSSGKATEVCSYSEGSQSMSGTYQYANGKITEWEMEDGSILMNTLGECPWTVTFITSTEIIIGDITFTKE